MSRLANANHRGKVIKALQRAGLEKDEGGKHTIMVHREDATRCTTIPRGSRIKPGTLRAIIKQCGLTEDEFLHLYRKR